MLGNILSHRKPQPDFFILGAQKAGTSWLWDMLDQHPGTSLPKEKEIHYFGSSELYSKGKDWYDDFFSDLEADKVIGDASTTYFPERIPFWHNVSRKNEFDDTLPSLPELIDSHYPDAKYIIILRDPVRRAVSAYSHWMKRGYESPLKGLKKLTQEWPKMRILEYGMYPRHLEAWLAKVPADRIKILIFEDQIQNNHERTLKEVYEYLGLDKNFTPALPSKPVHPSWSWTRILFSYYAGKLYKTAGSTFVAKFFDRHDFIPVSPIVKEDIEYLRSIYLPEKEKLEAILQRKLTSWDYGEKLLQTLKK